jgi:hypothetical protein
MKKILGASIGIGLLMYAMPMILETKPSACEAAQSKAVRETLRSTIPEAVGLLPRLYTKDQSPSQEIRCALEYWRL